MFDLKSKACEVSERGYCVLESVYDDREREQMRAIFKQLCDDKNGFSSEQPKISFHPLLEWGPKMAPFLQRRLSWTLWRRFFRMMFALHTAVLLSLTTHLLKKLSPIGMSTTRGKFLRQDFNGRIRSGCSAISMWTDLAPTLDH